MSEPSAGSENQQNDGKTLKFSGTIPMDDDLASSDAEDDESAPSLYSGEDAQTVDEGEPDEGPLDPAALEERRKQKRIERLDKRIKVLTKKKDKAGPKKPEKFQRATSDIKNKHKRQEVVERRRMEAHAEKKLKSLQTRKLREELGEEAVPRGKNETIESMRVPDETLMEDADDEDIIGEQNIDEFDKYFNRETTPRILMTTNRRPRGAIFDFLKELKLTIPNMEYYPRENFRIKGIIEECKERGFTDIMVF